MNEKELFQAIDEQDPGRVKELLKEGVNVKDSRMTPIKRHCPITIDRNLNLINVC